MTTLRLDELCSVIVDCEHKTAPISDAGQFYAVGTPAMKDHRIDYSRARRISQETFDSWTRRLAPRPGDLLLAREAPVGPVVLIPEANNVAPGQRTVLMRPDAKIVHSRFLYYLLTSPQQQAVLQVKSAGSTVHHLNVSDIRALPLDVPPLGEQQAIAEVLSALDDKIAANTVVVNSAELLAQTIYDAAERSAPRQPMGRLLSPILGGTPPRNNGEYWRGSQLWVSAKDITAASSSVIIDTEEHISASAVARTKAKPLPPGSVILTARGTVGKVARLAAPASFNQSCYGFVPGALPSSILYFAIRSATEQAKAMAHGSVFDTITMSTFDHLQIADFDPDSSASLESRLRPLLDTVTANVTENRTLAATRDALLPQLMSGKLRVRDAEQLASEAGA